MINITVLQYTVILRDNAIYEVYLIAYQIDSQKIVAWYINNDFGKYCAFKVMIEFNHLRLFINAKWFLVYRYFFLKNMQLPTLRLWWSTKIIWNVNRCIIKNWVHGWKLQTYKIRFVARRYHATIVIFVMVIIVSDNEMKVKLGMRVLFQSNSIAK